MFFSPCLISMGPLSFSNSCSFLCLSVYPSTIAGYFWLLKPDNLPGHPPFGNLSTKTQPPFSIWNSPFPRSISQSTSVDVFSSSFFHPLSLMDLVSVSLEMPELSLLDYYKSHTGVLESLFHYTVFLSHAKGYILCNLGHLSLTSFSIKLRMP